jgi:hypothetical protein
LTGEVVTLAGLELERTRFEVVYREESGKVFFATRGGQYVSRELRAYFLGTSDNIDETGARWKVTSAPVEVLFPGDAGFGATVPLHGCAVPVEDKK